MFSRRHPFLFFFLIFSAIISGTVLFVSLLLAIGTSGTDFISGDKVGVIEIKGVVVESKDVLRQIKEYREDESIKAVVLRINSPGGGVGPSQEIYREVRKTIKEKNVIASMGAVAASGGYYIASGTSGIIANPGTVTGSIGVIMGYTNFQEIFNKIGLKPVVVKSGQFKDMGSPVREMTKEEEKILTDFVNKIHMQFVKDVSEGRSMDMEKVKLLADGRIYTGEEAKTIGLVDRLGNLEDAVEWAGRLGGIEGEISTVYPKKEEMPFLEYLTGMSIHQIFKSIFHSSYSSSVSAEYIYHP
ncbi:MAG: signal peptide peptidase SppA [Deltaproteobacteria bacterium]|nr:signal peptide peptidase SppA [Deltaproteobacteria bacterium]